MIDAKQDDCRLVAAGEQRIFADTPLAIGVAQPPDEIAA